MYRIAVCDDDQLFLGEMTEALKKYFADSGVLHTIVTYQGGFGLIHDVEERVQFDIYILDIEMPGYSGIDVIKAIERNGSQPVIILVTSHLKYAVDSYAYNVLRFIPKPELKSRLPFALNAALARLDKQNALCYVVQSKRRYEKLMFGEIAYIYKEGKNSVFVLMDTIIKERKTLECVYAELNSDDFMFIDRCTIVNLQMIKGLDQKSMRILLKNGAAIVIAKIRMKELKQKLNSYWGENL